MKNENSNNNNNNNNYIHLEKRFNDYKIISIAFGGGASLIISALIILFAYDFNAEKERIHNLEEDLQHEIRESLGKGEKKPAIIICDRSGNSIENQVIDDGKIYYANPEHSKQYLEFIVYIKNIGNAVSGNLWFKYYSDNPLVIGHHETDDEKFNYSFIMSPDKHLLGNIPGGGFSIKYNMKIPIFMESKIPEKIYPMLLRIYNSDGLLKETIFRVKTFNQ